MDNHQQDLTDKEIAERKNSNTEWLPTKCRITKPPPPKPAANPLQFIKVAPCPLFQKAQEQIKKVEEIKVMRQDVSDEAEEWQQNLDNWKSSRRKRQEHIIERVVEVKKFEQEGHERIRKKSKTFNEMLEERNKRGHRLNIPIYDDDSNDLSDYGIGSSSSKTNSIKDVDTDDSTSLLDDKDHISDTHSAKDISSASNQSQSEDEMHSSGKLYGKEENILDSKNSTKTATSNFSSSSRTYENKIFKNKTNVQNVSEKIKPSLEPEIQQYTYEGAIQDYRSRIKSKINVDETIFNKQPEYLNNKSPTEPLKIGTKVDIYKRKEIFEVEKPLEIRHFESNTSRRLSEDFANSQSIKERLKSLEKCSDQSLKVEKNSSQNLSVKSRIKSFDKSTDADNKNNNYEFSNKTMKESIVSAKKPISLYLIDKSNGYESQNRNDVDKDKLLERCSSPETELYMNKLNMFNRDLDTFLTNSHSLQNGSVEYPASTSSADLIGLSSDREDSGIHTADVSCSVSQADESVEDSDLLSSTIPNCIEKLNQEKQKQLNESSEPNESIAKMNKHKSDDLESVEKDTNKLINNIDSQKNINDSGEKNSKKVIDSTSQFLENIKEQTNADFSSEMQFKSSTVLNIKDINEESKNKSKPNVDICKNFEHIIDKPVIYENVDIKPNIVDIYDKSDFPLAPPKAIEPPKEKPPPPPPLDNDESLNQEIGNLKSLTSAKRIKKEINSKRSSFLGLDERPGDELDLEVTLDRPPDITTFLQKESQLEKSLYKKLQINRDICLSEVESQDSGLESERGRLSSDTWCSGFGDSSTPVHGRQDSEHTNSVTSEEDEITKREREIIEMVEKEEKSRDLNDYSKVNDVDKSMLSFREMCCNVTYNSNDQIKSCIIQQQNSSYTSSLNTQDSEVLKVEHELLQLEREELERQRENMMFRESHEKLYRQQNRHSLENICDAVGVFVQQPAKVDYRKSMPELQKEQYSNKYCETVSDMAFYYKSIPEVELQYRKSMPNIQEAYLRSIPDYKKPLPEIYNEMHVPIEQRKSMPELQDVQISAFRSSPLNCQPIMPGKPLRPLIKEHQDKESGNKFDMNYQKGKSARLISRPGMHALSAVPKFQYVASDNWIQPKSTENKTKNYNQHWLYQEAELRRLADQQKNKSPKRNWQPTRMEKHIPEPIIQTLTRRVQNRAIINERNQPTKRPENSPSSQTYLNHSHALGHAAPVSYPPSIPTAIEDSQGKMLSVSGKKKCSYCGTELGRGAAMIIESLCLFYHMECFKCCVCHTQLGDGLMGTDVRVRNQKLHCHNCYSSDDGVKFSCV